jgi:hypothetical protein
MYIIFHTFEWKAIFNGIVRELIFCEAVKQRVVAEVGAVRARIAPVTNHSGAVAAVGTESSCDSSIQQ